MKITFVLLGIAIATGILVGAGDIISMIIVSLFSFGFFLAAKVAFQGFRWILNKSKSRIAANTLKAAEIATKMNTAKTPEIKPVQTPKPAYAGHPQQRHNGGNHNQQNFHRQQNQNNGQRPQGPILQKLEDKTDTSDSPTKTDAPEASTAGA